MRLPPKRAPHTFESPYIKIRRLILCVAPYLSLQIIIFPIVAQTLIIKLFKPLQNR